MARPHEPSSCFSHVSSLHGAIGNRSLARLLTSDGSRAQLQLSEGEVLRQQPKEGPKKDAPKKDAPKKDEPKKDEPKKEESKEAGWSRQLKSGPSDMEGWHASYDIKFDHVLPPVPKGATQLWQVVENHDSTMGEDCKVDTKHRFIVDIVDIGDRKSITDNWVWDPAGDPCFARKTAKAQVGFDDGKSKFTQQTNVLVSEGDAKDVIRKMKGPKGTYTGLYSFVHQGLCMKCKKEIEDLKKKHTAPDDEVLSIDGVGSFTTASMKKP
jgi:hypothetical protein